MRRGGVISWGRNFFKEKVSPPHPLFKNLQIGIYFGTVVGEDIILPYKYRSSSRNLLNNIKKSDGSPSDFLYVF